MEWHNPSSPWKSLSYPFNTESEDHCFWDAQGVVLVDTMPCGQSINSDFHIQTFQALQKHFRRVSSHKNVAEILQQDSAWSHTFENTKAITELGWTVSPTHHSAQMLLPTISTSLEPSKMSSMGKSLEVMKRLLKKWQYKIQTGTRRKQMLLFLTDTRLLKFMEIMHKNEVCNKYI